MRRRLAVACAAVLAVTGTAACGSDSGSEEPESLDGLTVTGEFGEEPQVEVEDLDVDGVETAVLIEGDGEEVTTEGAALYRFVIAKATDGETVASNYKDNEPQKMVLADEHEIIGEAVTGEQVGSRVALAMPVQDLLGAQGAPQVGLEPDDDLVMVIDLLELAEPPLTGPAGDKVDPPADAPKVVEEDGAVTGIDFSDAPGKAPSELQVIPLIEGDGPTVKQGDTVSVDYFGAVWGGDQAFDESYSRTPASFPLTEGGLIDGWVQGLDGVKVGSRVMLVVPPELGYGKQGSGEAIPPNSTLVFVVDVLGIDG